MSSKAGRKGGDWLNTFWDLVFSIFCFSEILRGGRYGQE